jgi:hypothetical protein
LTIRERETFPPVTLGHIRGHGCRDLLVYCGSIHCSYGAKMNADHLSDETHIRPLGVRMVPDSSPITISVMFLAARSARHTRNVLRSCRI